MVNQAKLNFGSLGKTPFSVGTAENLCFADGTFDAVVCMGVIEFLDNDELALSEMVRVLRPGGLFCSRLASTIGMEQQVRREQGRWHSLPDGTSRFLVDEAFLAEETRHVGATLADPLQTTVVQNQRSMTTWVLRKD